MVCGFGRQFEMGTTTEPIFVLSFAAVSAVDGGDLLLLLLLKEEFGSCQIEPNGQ